MAVVVVVADAGALSPAGAREPGARGDVLEAEAAEVAVEVAGRRGARRPSRRRASSPLGMKMSMRPSLS